MQHVLDEYDTVTGHNTVTDGDCDTDVNDVDRDNRVWWLCWVDEQLDWDGLVNCRLAASANEVVGTVVGEWGLCRQTSTDFT